MARAAYAQDRSVAMILYRNQEEVSRLPPVGTLWWWQDAVGPVGQSVLQRLETSGLVERVHASWWSATEELAGHMQSNHRVELEGAPGIGQDVFDVPGQPGARSGSSRSGSSSSLPGSQATLDGDEAEVGREEPRIPAEWRGARARDPEEFDGQKSLQDIDSWLPNPR